METLDKVRFSLGGAAANFTEANDLLRELAEDARSDVERALIAVLRQRFHLLIADVEAAANEVDRLEAYLQGLAETSGLS